MVLPTAQYRENCIHVLFQTVLLPNQDSQKRMAKFDEESDNIVSKISKEFIDEQPKIGTAVKNLIAMVLGKATSCPSASLLFESDHIFTPEMGLSCGRCLLQAIQRLELEEPLLWGLSNPQLDDETGEKRLDEVLKYKCLYDMRMRMSLQKDVRVSLLFGRSYIKASKSWSTIKKSVILPPNVDIEMFNYFIQNFENSLLLDDKDEIKNVKNDATLVWATNFYEALNQRQEKRKSEAAKRIASDAIIAARDAELSDWEDSDDDNYIPRKIVDGEDEEEFIRKVVNINIQKIEE